MSQPALIPAAHLLSPHGLKGQFRAKILLEDPQLLRTAPLATNRPGLTVTVTLVAPQPNGTALLTLKDVSDRTTAEALGKLTLYLPREALPPTQDNEVYLHDLLGRPVNLPNGTLLGTATHILSTGAQDLLEVQAEGRKPVLIPLHPDFIENLTATPLVLTDYAVQLLD